MYRTTVHLVTTVESSDGPLPDDVAAQVADALTGFCSRPYGNDDNDFDSWWLATVEPTHGD